MFALFSVHTRIKALMLLILLVHPDRAAHAAGSTITSESLAASNRPKKITEFAKDHFHIGYWVNGGDTFYYRGDADAFNACLEKYARLDATTTHVLYLSDKEPVTDIPWMRANSQNTPCDWAAACSDLRFFESNKNHPANKTHRVVVIFYKRGKIPWDKVQVPKNVIVENR